MSFGSRGLVACAQNILVADKYGDVLFTYNAMPCRNHLPLIDGGWVEGANPQYILDGTRYGGFEIPLDAEGMPDESFQAEPQRCVIPFEEMPQARTPEEGFVMSTNHDIAEQASTTTSPTTCTTSVVLVPSLSSPYHP